MRVFHAHLALLDPQYAPRSVAQLKNVTLKTLYSKVFVNCSNYKIAGLQYNGIISRIGNSAAGSDRRQARSSSSPQPPVNRVMMKIRRTPAALRRKAFGEHPHHSVKLFSL